MDGPDRQLYASYQRAIATYNQALECLNASPALKQGCRLNLLSEAEFPPWWEAVARDSDIQRRWLARFADPEGVLRRSRERMTAILGEAHQRGERAA